MTKIIYKEDNPVKTPYIFPALLAVIAIGAGIYNFFDLGGFNALFIEKALIPCTMAVIVAGIIALITKNKMKKIVDEFKEIREKGQVVEGTVSEIVKHTYYSTDNNHHTYEHYKYSFLVTYTDPLGNLVTAESIETDTNFTLKGQSCKAIVFGGKIIVDEAEVEAVAEPKKWPVILVLGIIFAVLVFIFTRQ